MKELPANYDEKQVESKWQQTWASSDAFKWDPNVARENTFVVDTPPPTVSGSLHMGHVFSYTHQDLIVRFQRMLGKNICFPVGWDDNGLPTERRVQNYLGIKCNPSLAYSADWKPTVKPANEKNDKKEKEDKYNVEHVSRRNFIEACSIVTREDETAFKRLWQRLGLSMDWSSEYATIDEDCRRVSQYSFLDLVEKGQLYNATLPTMWDVDFQSAIAQAEVEDKEIGGAFHDIRFGVEDGGEFTIATTRPELIAACIAVVAHPDDQRYQQYFGKNAITPLFGATVPILASEHAQIDKGTGIMMICTFGDAADVEWWRRSKLPVKQIVDLNGKMIDINFGVAPFESLNPAQANKYNAELKGLYVKQAKKKIAELLAQDGTSVDGKNKALIGEPKQIMHAVKFYEKGDRPLEFIPTRQWFIKLLEHKEQFLKQGEKIKWHPAHMRTRYDNWVMGLNQDWCISRQRYFGVPFPVWYTLDAKGQANYEKPIFAKRETLPIDPLSDVPPGYKAEQRDQPNGFTGDPDVMDTWATSALSPQIISKWGTDPARHKNLFPMDIRPQSHEIIRTWAFYTIVKAWMHEGQVPWHNVVISGWILDPDRKKMSKSKGNVVTPEPLLEQYSPDAVRYWAGRARLGADTAFEDTVFKIGKRLITKIFNASKFVFGQIDRVAAANSDSAELKLTDITDRLDLSFVNKMKVVIEHATQSFESFEFAASLQASEEAFWSFCDDYLELVKIRSYADSDSAGRRSAIATLNWSLQTFLKLFAPFLPYVTEEVWSWRYAGSGKDSSIHTSSWPKIEGLKALDLSVPADVYNCASEVIAKIRGSKTDAKKSLRWPVTKVVVSSNKDKINYLSTVLTDVAQAGNVNNNQIELNVVDQQNEIVVSVELAAEGN